MKILKGRVTTHTGYIAEVEALDQNGYEVTFRSPELLDSQDDAEAELIKMKNNLDIQYKDFLIKAKENGATDKA